jgi:hypothetical protein
MFHAPEMAPPLHWLQRRVDADELDLRDACDGGLLNRCFIYMKAPLCTEFAPLRTTGNH